MFSNLGCHVRFVERRRILRSRVMLVDVDKDPKKVIRAGLIGGMLALVLGLSVFVRVAIAQHVSIYVFGATVGLFLLGGVIGLALAPITTSILPKPGKTRKPQSPKRE
jgi:hypothetical protein